MGGDQMRNTVDDIETGGPDINIRRRGLTSDSDSFASFPVLSDAVSNVIDAFAPHPRPKLATRSSFYRRVGKRVFDITLILMTLPFTVLLIGLSALALWIEGGNPFYSQDRLGKGGATFRLFKLRTMTRDAETVLDRLLEQDDALRHEWETTQKLRKDPRITRVGQFLRRTSIDELPQLWNVIKGDMSLIGPRPMMPQQLDLYGDPASYYAVRPGLSGFWQVQDRNDSHFAYRAIIDRTYEERMSFWVDFTIVWRTFSVVLRGTGF